MKSFWILKYGFEGMQSFRNKFQILKIKNKYTIQSLLFSRNCDDSHSNGNVFFWTSKTMSNAYAN